MANAQHCRSLRAHRLRLARSLVMLFMLPGAATADIISFDTNDWDHGSGAQTGWNDGELAGTTTFGSTTLTITSQVVGTATATGDHMFRLNESYFTGFAFQLDPGTTNNNGSLSNYLRLDFEFSQPVYLDSFTLTDVDRTDDNWFDIIAAEGFVNGLGSVGSGLAANYSFENPTNLTEVTRFGLESARPRNNTGNVQNTLPADATFDFDDPVRAFSLYYWNHRSGDSGATTQTIGIRGNQFEVTSISTPEPAALALCLVFVGLFLLHVRQWQLGRI